MEKPAYIILERSLIISMKCSLLDITCRLQEFSSVVTEEFQVRLKNSRKKTNMNFEAYKPNKMYETNAS